MAHARQLKRSSPEAEGIPAAAVLDFVHAVEQHDHPLAAVQGFMLLRHGNVAAEGWWAPYGPQAPHSLYSLSKSFTSTAVGLAVAEGRLTVDDPILTFFSEDAPAHPSANLKAMRVRHLLSMNTGHHEDTTRQVFRHLHQIKLSSARSSFHQDTTGLETGDEDNWPRTFLSRPVEHEPGSWFVYNTAATYMLSAIITKLTDESLLDYLRPRLFEPLGIAHPTWETDPRGINLGGTGLHIKTEDIARFGQLYLDRGIWQGQRIVPERWVAEATAATSDNSNTQTNPDWTVGYGYQFWRCRHGAYRGDGAFGQFCIIMPEQDAVLAITSGLQDMQGVLDNVWQHLLPAMQPHPVPADPASSRELSDKLASLALPLPPGQPSSPEAAHWSGKTYQLDSNDLSLESVAIEFGDDRATFVVRDQRGEHAVRVGHGTWLPGRIDVLGHGDEPVAAAGAWTADDTYETRVCFVEGVFCPVIRVHFSGGDLRLEMEPNASRGVMETTTTLDGHLANETGKGSHG